MLLKGNRLTSAPPSAWSQLDTFLGVVLVGFGQQSGPSVVCVWPQQPEMQQSRSLLSALQILLSLPSAAWSLSGEKSLNILVRLEHLLNLPFDFKKKKNKITSSLDRCCSFITSMYVLICILGSGVLPPMRKSTNKMRDGQPSKSQNQHFHTQSTTVNCPWIDGLKCLNYYPLITKSPRQ